MRRLIVASVLAIGIAVPGVANAQPPTPSNPNIAHHTEYCRTTTYTSYWTWTPPHTTPKTKKHVPGKWVFRPAHWVKTCLGAA